MSGVNFKPLLPGWPGVSCGFETDSNISESGASPFQGKLIIRMYRLQFGHPTLDMSACLGAGLAPAAATFDRLGLLPVFFFFLLRPSGCLDDS